VTPTCSEPGRIPQCPSGKKSEQTWRRIPSLLNRKGFTRWNASLTQTYAILAYFTATFRL
jgi:hypothetical protein